MKADHTDITKKVKIARGQLDGILRMIALLKNVNKMILKAHIRSCVKEALETEEDNPKVEEALTVLEKMADLS